MWIPQVLTNGTLLLVDACSHPDLFWALRGGGGGTFGIVTAAHHRLHERSPITIAMLTINPNMTSDPTFAIWAGAAFSWVDFWVDESPYLDRRWGGHWNELGFASGLFFMGNADDAETTFMRKLRSWKTSLDPWAADMVTIRAFEVPKYVGQCYGHCRERGVMDSEHWTNTAGATDLTTANRLVPREFVIQNSSSIKEFLKLQVISGHFGNLHYLLGGAMSEIGHDETSVHPAMRQALYQFVFTNTSAIAAARELLPASVGGGVGYNHAFRKEPNWASEIWGANLARLVQLKLKYDPEHRLNCYQCVGFQLLGTAANTSQAPSCMHPDNEVCNNDSWEHHRHCSPTSEDQNIVERQS